MKTLKMIYKDFKPFLVIASAAWIFGFMGLLGAYQAGKLVGVSLAIAYESPAEEQPADE